MVEPELIEAYCTAKYVVETKMENAVMRVGQRSAQVAELISMHQAQSAAFVTPCNPRSAAGPGEVTVTTLTVPCAISSLY